MKIYLVIYTVKYEIYKAFKSLHHAQVYLKGLKEARSSFSPYFEIEELIVED